MRENWIKIDEFLQITGININEVRTLISSGQINAKYIDGELFVDSISGTNALVKTTQNTLANNADAGFIEQSIGTILSLHDKVIEAKDETIAAIKNENVFLKDALLSAKESQNEDKRTIDALKEEIATKKQELESMQRKYKLMWGKMLNKES